MGANSAFATVADLAAEWRPLGPEESERANALLEYASAKLRRELARAGREVDGEDRDQAVLLRSTCCAMVRRVMAAGTGAEVSQVSQTAGSFNAQATYANPAGNMYITADERRDLGVAKRRSRIGFIAPWKGDADEPAR